MPPEEVGGPDSIEEFAEEFDAAISAVRLRRMLDNIIRYWRESDEDHAVYYVDAYQSMRANIFGATLPEEDR